MRWIRLKTMRNRFKFWFALLAFILSYAFIMAIIIKSRAGEALATAILMFIIRS